MSTTTSYAEHDDFLVQELNNARLRLRNELNFFPHQASGTNGYLLEDPINSKYYRIGLAEYHFISLLDGDTSVGDALAATASARPDDALTEHEAASLCQWLIDMNLASTDCSSTPARLQRAAAATRRKRFAALANPMFIRIPLLRPDRLVELLYWCLGWLFSGPGLLLALAVGIGASFQIAAQSDRFLASTDGIFTVHNYLGLTICWIVLKVLHELGHGVACKKFGGYVREAGVILILCLPIAYVDVTSSWRFRSKWQRILTAAAGMYVEFVIAAVAAWIWCLTPAGPINQLCTNVVLMASLTTVLFNINPLMRFDGYYMLSDLLKIPNLYGSGQQYLRYAAKRYLFGLESSRPPWREQNAMCIRVYGVAALFWRLLICASLLTAAAVLFHGAGIVIAAVGAVFWIAMPVTQFARFFNSDALNTSHRRRFVLTSSALATVLIVLPLVLPWPFTRTAPAVVEYDPLTIVRTGTTGFVRELSVTDGQSVEKGQVLAKLENRQLDVELAELELSIEQSRLKSLAYQNRHEMAAYQAEMKEIEGLVKRRTEKQAQIEQLVLRAPGSGMVMGRNLESMLGTYLAEGDPLLTIGRDEIKEVRLSIAQHDVDAFHGVVGSRVTIRVPGVRTIACPLTRITPRASKQPSHPSLCAVNGGPLAVKQADENATESELELLEPRFSATVSLDVEQSRLLAAGQRATVKLSVHDESIATHIWRVATTWLDERLGAGS